ncbi:MAG: acyl carrier protein [Anaerolineae bacterium]
MITAKRNRGLPFDEFRRILASELRVDEERIVPEASFITDLRVDSTRVVDTMLRLEDRGIDIPLELAWQIETVGDAYQAMLYTNSH